MKPARGRSRRTSQAEGFRNVGWQRRHAPNDPEQESAEYDDAFRDERSRVTPQGESPAAAGFDAGPGAPQRGSLNRPAESEAEDWAQGDAAAYPDDWAWDLSPDDASVEADAVADDLPSSNWRQEAQPSRFVTSPTGYAPPVWSWAGYAWRFGSYLTIPRINRLLRLGLQRILPQTPAARFVMMGIPPELVDETLRQVRHLDDWAEAWTGTAQRFLSETRRGGNLLSPQEAALARQRAAMCYHVAPFFALGDDRLARASRSSATTLFNQSVGLLMPDTRRVAIRWRTKSLPGYLTLPSHVAEQVPLVVLLNGLTTSKEELVMWQDAFLRQQLAVLALDWPGTGEATPLGPIRPDCDDITDGLFEFIEEEPAINGEQVVLVGLSLGAAVAISSAAQDRRVAATVVVTPLYEPWMWLGAANELTLAQIATATGGYDRLARYAVELNLPTAVERLRVPLLVLGAGRDLVVPPAEAARLAATAGDLATLIWYEQAGHALFDALPTWTEDVAGWIAMIFGLVDELPRDRTTADLRPTDWGAADDESRAEPEAAERSVRRERVELPPPPSGTDFGPLGPAAARILAGEPPSDEEPGATAVSQEPEDREAAAEPARQAAVEHTPPARSTSSDAATSPPDLVTTDEPPGASAGESPEARSDPGEEPSGGVRTTGTFAGGRARATRAQFADDDRDQDDSIDDPNAPYRPPRRPER